MAQSLNVVPADTYYVSTEGRNHWSGRLAEPNADRTDGPFATVAHARDLLRQLKARGQMGPRLMVYLRGGRYFLSEPLTFGPEDSAPVTYASYPGEQAILDGGTRIEGWKSTEVNGRKAWVADLPDVAEGKWAFRSLFADDGRRQRPRLPKEGRFRMEEVPGMPMPISWAFRGFRQFRAAKGDLPKLRNAADAEVVAFHFWIDERLPVESYDPATRLVTTSRESRAPLVEAHGDKLAPYYVENVFEALTDPGEWYLDRPAGKLYYIPRRGEAMRRTEVYAPRLRQFLRLIGDPKTGRHVQWLRFENLRFEHADWVQPGETPDSIPPGWDDTTRSTHRYCRGNAGSAAQAACDVTGAIVLYGARNCAIEDCRIAHAGFYGIEVGDGSSANRIVGNELVDLGAGGVKINGAAFEEAPELRTGYTRVTDNHIHQCGRVFHAGIGILAMHTFNNVLSHNHIHDLYYSGISCGWRWGIFPHITAENLIEHNHIHDIGQGVLSDMGGIYTLGVQPGTVLRGNLIHDVNKLNYGAWCIYPDEGSAHILIENNVCYRTNGEAFHQHYGRENVVRNNVFAFGADAVAAHGRTQKEHKAFSFEKNIFLSARAPMFQAGYGVWLKDRNHRSDLNLYWVTDGSEPTFADHKQGGKVDGVLGWDAWRELGHDRHSIVADPKFADAENGDFTLAKDSPALEVGFVPIDLSGVGPRSKEDRD